MGSARAFFAAILIALTSACTWPAWGSGHGALEVDMHRLLEPPTLDPLHFSPAHGSMESILAVHAAMRAQALPVESALVEGHFTIRSMLGQDTFVATENYSSDGSTGWVTLARDGTDMYRIETGMASPVTALRGLWTYDGHWVLETAYISPETVRGRITRDGTVLNDALEYSDAFNFQLIDGRPFYFFARHGKIGYSFDGRASVPAFDEVPDYGCCSAAELNPRQARNLVAFFARQGDTWYYVEITSGS